MRSKYKAIELMIGLHPLSWRRAVTQYRSKAVIYAYSQVTYRNKNVLQCPGVLRMMQFLLSGRSSLRFPHKVMVVTMRVYGKMSMGAISKEFEDHSIHFAKSSVESLLKCVEIRAAEKGGSIFDLSIYQNNAGRGRKEALSDAQKDFLITFIRTDESTRKLDSRHILEKLPSDFPRVHQSTLESTLYERGLLRKDGYWRSNPALDRELERLLSAYNRSPDEPALFDVAT